MSLNSNEPAYTRALFNAANSVLDPSTWWVFEFDVTGVDGGKWRRRIDMIAVQNGHLLMVEWDRIQHRNKSIHDESLRQTQLESQHQYESITSLRINTSEYRDSSGQICNPTMLERISTVMASVSAWETTATASARSAASIEYLFYDQVRWNTGKIDLVRPLVASPGSLHVPHWCDAARAEVVQRWTTENITRQFRKFPACRGGTHRQSRAEVVRTDMIVAVPCDTEAASLLMAFGDTLTSATCDVSPEGNITSLSMRPRGALWSELNLLVLVGMQTNGVHSSDHVKSTALCVANAIADRDAMSFRLSPYAQRRWGLGAILSEVTPSAFSTFVPAINAVRLLSSQSTLSCYVGQTGYQRDLELTASVRECVDPNWRPLPGITCRRFAQGPQMMLAARVAAVNLAYKTGEDFARNLKAIHRAAELAADKEVAKFAAAAKAAEDAMVAAKDAAADNGV